MQILKTRLTIPPDGNLTIALPLEEAGLEVDVTVTPRRKEMSQTEWEAFIDRTAGSISDATFGRPPQVDSVERASLD